MRIDLNFSPRFLFNLSFIGTTCNAKRRIEERLVGSCQPVNIPQVLQYDYLIPVVGLQIPVTLIIPSKIHIFGIGEIGVFEQRQMTDGIRGGSWTKDNRIVACGSLRSWDFDTDPSSFFTQLTWQRNTVIDTLQLIWVEKMGEYLRSSSSAVLASQFSSLSCSIVSLHWP